MSTKNAIFFPQNFIFSNLYRFKDFHFLFYGATKYTCFRQKNNPNG